MHVFPKRYLQVSISSEKEVINTGNHVNRKSPSLKQMCNCMGFKLNILFYDACAFHCFYFVVSAALLSRSLLLQWRSLS